VRKITRKNPFDERETARMLTLSLVSLLAGAVLGMRFKVLILLPAISAALLAILAIGITSAAAFSTIALAMVLATTCLQLGYLGGVTARHGVALTRDGLIHRIWHGRAASVR
jgi:hypothetical protein